mmetsp:Transcript_73009/g.226925  ORF Transcript_73009/g.226925 Transcript_73009/m.226925 type:complete len:129 (+) Transcript_73009:3-389(+)
MEDLVREGRRDAALLCRQPPAAEWAAGTSRRQDYLRRISSALQRALRKSVEVRCVAIVRREGRYHRASTLAVLRAHGQVPKALDGLGVLDCLLDFELPETPWRAWLLLILFSLALALVGFVAFHLGLL